MPPKALFDNSHRPDKLVFPACIECNSGTATADLIASIVSRWEYNNSAQGQKDHARLVTQAKRKCPEIVREWISEPNSRDERLNHLRLNGVNVPSDAGLAMIGPLTVRQLNLFAHKATLALYFEEFKAPLPNAGGVFAMWRTKEDFAKDGIPGWLLEMLPRYSALSQGSWTEADTFEYRFESNRREGLFGCFAKLRRGLFISGFAVHDTENLPPGDEGWISPGALLSSLDSPRFVKKI